MFDLTGKTALVTGSTQGIGEAIARALHAAGATVWIHGATSLEKCRRVCDSLGERAFPIQCDLARPDCAAVIHDATGDLDIVVSNASVQFRKAWNEVTHEEYETQMNVNLRAFLDLAQVYAPAMAENGWGRILAVGSVQQYKPHKDMIVYAASKCAQMSMVENLAKQLAPSGVTVNNLSPGVILTPRNDAALADSDYAAKVYAGIPAGYGGEPKDCVGAALLLCSDAGRYITGIDLTVDGGMKL